MALTVEKCQLMRRTMMYEISCTAPVTSGGWASSTSFQGETTKCALNNILVSPKFRGNLTV